MTADQINQFATLLEQGASQSEIARALGVSRQRVWQIIRNAEGRCMTCGDRAMTATRCYMHARQESLKKRARRQPAHPYFRPDEYRPRVTGGAQ